MRVVYTLVHGGGPKKNIETAIGIVLQIAQEDCS